MAEEELVKRRSKTCRDRVRQKEWYPMPWDGHRRTAQFETVDEDYRMFLEKHSRNIEAKRYKLDQYRIFYYGPPEQLLKKKKQLCGDLKQQLEFNEARKIRFCDTIEEGIRLARKVEASIKKEKEEHNKKYEFLMKNIRDCNKTLIEVRAEQRKKSLIQTKSEEKEILKHNPINWNKTLN